MAEGGALGVAAALKGCQRVWGQGDNGVGSPGQLERTGCMQWWSWRTSGPPSDPAVGRQGCRQGEVWEMLDQKAHVRVQSQLLQPVAIPVSPPIPSPLSTGREGAPFVCSLPPLTQCLELCIVKKQPQPIVCTVKVVGARFEPGKRFSRVFS